MDGIPPERMVTDSWPALHGRPVLRRTVAVGLVLCVSVAAALVVRGVNALTAGGVGGRETDRDRAERLAGLHPSQHPGAGRYYVPVGAVYTRTSDGAPIAYLHYRLGGGKEPGLGDFLRTYDLPEPGPAAPLPPDLAAALGGDEPAEAPELPEEPASPSAPSSGPSAAGAPDASATPAAPDTPAAPSASAAPAAAAAPAAIAAEPTPTEADPDGAGNAAVADEPEDDAPGNDAPVDGTPGPSPSPTPTPTPTWTPTATPSAVPTHAPTARRIYVATIPGGLPGAADIYIRATG
ncbi:hypothetical protein ACIG5E_23070 [Kitasatospora sp. NPDC053057]|uniref:hypothetical protein n=1 Tax=Kitasatospora sp. NPDC053057 TaxID=3364062 RepID=UPI0037C7BFD0